MTQASLGRNRRGLTKRVCKSGEVHWISEFVKDFQQIQQYFLLKVPIRLLYNMNNQLWDKPDETRKS